MTTKSKPTRKQILTFLAMVPTSTAEELSQLFGWSPRETQNLLHKMDDDDQVIMRNGIYKISEKSRSEIDRGLSGR